MKDWRECRNRSERIRAEKEKNRVEVAKAQVSAHNNRVNSMLNMTRQLRSLCVSKYPGEDMRDPDNLEFVFKAVEHYSGVPHLNRKLLTRLLNGTDDYFRSFRMVIDKCGNIRDEQTYSYVIRDGMEIKEEDEKQLQMVFDYLKQAKKDPDIPDKSSVGDVMPAAASLYFLVLVVILILTAMASF